MWSNFDYLVVLVFLERWSRKWLTDYIIICIMSKSDQKGDQGFNDVTNVCKLTHKTYKLWNHYIPIPVQTLFAH